eukprot:5875121-Alexandrium_andersonii.AAC.1
MFLALAPAAARAAAAWASNSRTSGAATEPGPSAQCASGGAKSCVGETGSSGPGRASSRDRCSA